MNTSNTGSGEKKTEIILDLLVEAARAFGIIQEAGKKIGAVSETGKRIWALLRILKLYGPQTVPQIARMRSVSRQYIQRLANDIVEEGYAEFGSNPGHKRSQFLKITPKGEELYFEVYHAMRENVEPVAPKFKEEELEATNKVLKSFIYELEHYLGKSRK
jgi:DNA-binding MarR family transcriptional regulator